MDNISRTARILAMINDNGLTVSGLERDLGYSNGAFKVRGGKMSEKVLDRLDEYFEDPSGIREQVLIEKFEQERGELDAGDHELIREMGNHRPTYSDGVWRFRDVYDIKGNDGIQNNGLWKRYNDWAYIGHFDADKLAKGELKLKKGWGSVGDVDYDDLGAYIKLENGIKVYLFEKV